MARVGRAEIKMEMTGVRAAQEKVRGLGASIMAVGSRLKGAFAIGAALGATGVLGFGVKLAAEAEQAQVAFKTMLGSAEKAKDVLGDLRQFAAETPFQLPELVGAARKLLAFGTSARDVVAELRMIGDVSAGVGSSVGDIAEIYGKARVQGRLFAEDMNQLTGRGIPIIGLLADQFKVATSDVRKLVESGQVGFPQIQQAFRDMTSDGGRFFKMMEEQSKTASGLFSTLKDNLGAIARSIGEEILPLMKASTDLMLALMSKGEGGGAPTAARLSSSLLMSEANLIGFAQTKANRMVDPQKRMAALRDLAEQARALHMEIRDVERQAEERGTSVENLLRLSQAADLTRAQYVTLHAAIEKAQDQADRARHPFASMFDNLKAAATEATDRMEKMAALQERIRKGAALGARLGGVGLTPLEGALRSMRMERDELTRMADEVGAGAHVKDEIARRFGREEEMIRERFRKKTSGGDDRETATVAGAASVWRRIQEQLRPKPIESEIADATKRTATATEQTAGLMEKFVSGAATVAAATGASFQ